MTKKRPNIVISLLGTLRDRNPDDKPEGEPLKEWRPTIGLCRQRTFHVGRLELIYSTGFDELADDVGKEVRKASPSTEVRLHKIDLKGDEPWDPVIMYERLSAFANDYKFSPNEDYYIHLTTGTDIAKVCIFLLTEREVFPSAKLIHTSPHSKDGEDKTIGSYKIIDLKDSKYDPITLHTPSDPIEFLKGGLETKNAAYNKMIETIKQVAIYSKDPILLIGPTGSGKTKHARRIWGLKKQKGVLGERAPFVDINCATIRGDLAKSELFGHVKGAFSGAIEDREGSLLRANGGILFLDEIGELGRDEQAMLLKAIEEKRFCQTGSDEEVKSEFQLIAGTNRDLQTMVSDGKFREDLYSRISLWTFPLPGLRDRPEDIAPNIEYQLKLIGQEEKRVIHFEPSALGRYLKFACSDDALWTGNFRDLIGSIRRLVTLSASTGGWIRTSAVEDEIKRLQYGWRMPRKSNEAEKDELLQYAEESGKYKAIDLIQLAEVLKICRKSSGLKEAGAKLYNKSKNPSSSLKRYLETFELEMGPGGVIKIIDPQKKESGPKNSRK